MPSPCTAGTCASTRGSVPPGAGRPVRLPLQAENHARDRKCAEERGQLDASATPERSVAVLSFLNLGDNREWEPLQKGLADMVIRDLAGVDGLNVVDRTKLDQILYELGLNASSLGIRPRPGAWARSRSPVPGQGILSGHAGPEDDAGRRSSSFLKADQPTTFSEDGSLSTIFQMEKQIVLRIVDFFGITLTTRQKESVLEIPTENVSRS